MEKHIINLIALIALSLVLISGFVLGRYAFPKTVTVENTIQGPQIFVSERITACESKGGKYRLFWSTYKNEYTEWCEVLQTEIEDF